MDVEILSPNHFGNDKSHMEINLSSNTYEGILPNFHNIMKDKSETVVSKKEIASSIQENSSQIKMPTSHQVFCALYHNTLAL